jgi:hypothetical protein
MVEHGGRRGVKLSAIFEDTKLVRMSLGSKLVNINIFPPPTRKHTELNDEGPERNSPGRFSIGLQWFG